MKYVHHAKSLIFKITRDRLRTVTKITRVADSLGEGNADTVGRERRKSLIAMVGDMVQAFPATATTNTPDKLNKNAGPRMRSGFFIGESVRASRK